MARGTRSVEAHVALLRGVNVGGKNLLPMTELVALFDEARCSNVRTYIQSGNVVFHPSGEQMGRLAERITRAISERFGLKVPVVLRSASELRALVRQNPFLARGLDAASLHVAFLAERPAPAKVRALDPERSRPDELRVLGRDVYLYCPDGVARTKLSNDYFERALGTTSTLRNWKTVLKLAEMVEAS